MSTLDTDSRYPPIAEYATVSDCHCMALVSRAGSVDWCCMPRIDDDSLFGRLLDWDKGGFCAISPVEKGYVSTRRYLPGTMMLETRFCTPAGEVMLYDFFAMDEDGLEHPRYDLVRIVDGITGEVELSLDICPRFDYGEIVPRMQRHPSGVYTAIGSNKGLLIHSDVPLKVIEHRDLSATVRVAASRRIRLVLKFQVPELIESAIAHGLPDQAKIDRAFEHTRAWWSDWSARIRAPFEVDFQTLRSAITLKSLTFERTGAIAAAATTSLPESIGGQRNWDYRFSWVRDSLFTVRALHDLGYVREADRFHQFIERSSAGSADELQIMYGVDGKRRLTEIELDWLEGYRRSRPVRIGNRAAKQLQMDIYGELVEMAWEWHANGHQTDPDYWTFLVDVIDTVCERWPDRDHGIWEVRAEPVHYVHSKVMCWAALNRGIMLAKDKQFKAPVERWIKNREELRVAVETRGYDPQRGIFVQAFDSNCLDAALLLLPRVGFIAYDDPRMQRTTDAICIKLDRHGLLVRYDSTDNLPGNEGVFLPCTFWLVTCLARQGQRERAWQYYERALSCANDVGLFSEEFDVDNWSMLGNFPQGLTHVSQITARLALAAIDNHSK
ncbi:glycoside hydrolase family 15 protein [Herbaspirillum sp. GCM10030257]|uniref:glycoside hydrolase family 15 protein n=1 Tax=Herbaspirillum sp. GCM10030257 TaxID=3273393 RepID=UPI00360871A2